MSDSITWKNVTIKLSQLKPWEQNPRQSTAAQAKRILQSMSDFGQVQTVAISPDGEVYDGHQRLSALLAVHGGEYEIDARQSSRPLSDYERRGLVVALHATAAGEWDWDELANWDLLSLLPDGFADDWLEQLNYDGAMVATMLGAEDDALGETDADAEPQTSRADELQAEWGTELGQLWQIGEHRLLIGDCTVAENVERLMGGEKAVLIHADPPYGMGKEKDGIANDNLYRDKLDAFQMQWWLAARPHVEDNASAYIWGNAEDLWRLWYGLLSKSERLTFRNEIVWDKTHGQGMGSDQNRMFPTATERVLFFMLGEQGFNNNADNYWEGWEPVRSYLEQEMKRCGWTVADLNRITGTQMGGQHWVTRSQWGLITEEHYKTIQRAAREHDAFKREHDELKRDFYATRAYFDNTHDNMTDVWQFQRVQGEDRHGHATPKLVEMVTRAIKSSCPEGGLTYAPFAGTGPEFVACQNTGRKCYSTELSPAYGAVILQRMIEAFPTLDIYQVE